MSFLSKLKKVIKPLRPILSALPVVGTFARAAEGIGKLHKTFVQPAKRAIKGAIPLIDQIPSAAEVGASLGMGAPMHTVAQMNAQLAREASMLPMLGALGRGALSLGGLAMGMGGVSRIPAIRGAVGWVLSATGRAIAWVTASGARFSKRKAWDLAKKVGLETAALTLGMSAIELAQWLFGDPGAMPGRRRRRGISHGQLQTAKRVNRRVLAMVCDLQDMGKVKVSGIRRGTCK